MPSRVWELYSSLVEYPEDWVVPEIHSLAQQLRRLNPSTPAIERLELFANSAEHYSVTELQELYTQTFDLSPMCSPHVGYHIFGESYKRGALMAQLREEYHNLGLSEGSEIPDHLAYLLKYCSVLVNIESKAEVHKELLNLILYPGLSKMVDSFADSTNPYKYLVESLLIWLAPQIGIEVNPSA